MTAKAISLKKYLPLLLLLILTSLLLIDGFNYWSGKKLSRNIDGLSRVFIKAVDLSINSDRDLYQAHTASQNYLMKLSVNNITASQELTKFAENARQAQERMREAKSLLKNYPQVEQVMASFESDYTIWISSAQLMFNMANAGRLEEARNFNNNILHEHFLQLRQHYDVMGEVAREIANTAVSQ